VSVAANRRAALALFAGALLAACSATSDVFIGQDDPASRAVADSAAGQAGSRSEPPTAAEDAAVMSQRPPDPDPPPPPPVIDAGSGGTAGSDAEPDEDDDDEEDPLDAAVTPVGCSAGTADCDGDPANGCEVTTDSDMQHCGGCDRLCHANGHDARGAQCVAGRCELVCSTDPFGDHDCDFEPDNGCETPLRTDDENCGECGRVCTCFNGSCL